jgi:uncharacterized DUF497 family protein
MKRHRLKISQRILSKLKEKHCIEIEEVWECFINRMGGFLEDTRLHNKTEPPTLWFIAETNKRRLLKIVFIELANRQYELKTAYEPNDKEVNIYEKYS